MVFLRIVLVGRSGVIADANWTKLQGIQRKLHG
jgi:hypothetical protein